MSEIIENKINIISEETVLEGKIVLDCLSRVHGTLEGEVIAKKGSELILAETSIVRGNIHGDTVIVDGFVQGDIEATTRVIISSTGRVSGNIATPSLDVKFGAHFEGRANVLGNS